MSCERRGARRGVKSSTSTTPRGDDGRARHLDRALQRGHLRHARRRRRRRLRDRPAALGLQRDPRHVSDNCARPRARHGADRAQRAPRYLVAANVGAHAATAHEHLPARRTARGDGSARRAQRGAGRRAVGRLDARQPVDLDALPALRARAGARPDRLPVAAGAARAERAVGGRGAVDGGEAHARLGALPADARRRARAPGRREPADGAGEQPAGAAHARAAGPGGRHAHRPRVAAVGPARRRDEDRL